MDVKKVGLVLLVVGISLVISFKFVGFASQGTVPSSVTIVDESETPLGGESSGGGSGGSPPVLPPNAFTVDKDLIKVRIKQGETLRETLTITNTGTKILAINNIEIEGVENLIAISQTSLTLSPGYSKQIFIDIFAKEDEPPNAYIGRLKVSGNGIEKFVNVIIEVKSRSPLFDVQTKLAKNRLIPGENVVAEINVLNMGDLGNIDVVLYYAIRSFEGNTIAFRSESIAIDDALNLVRQLNVPADTVPGPYEFYVRASYEDAVAASSESFEVIDVSSTPIVRGNIAWFILIIVILMLIIFFLLWKRRKDEEKKTSRVKTAPEVVYVGGR